MKNTKICEAWDAVNPTSAQKKRMRAVLEAKLNAPAQVSSEKAIWKEQKDDFPNITTMDLTTPPSGAAGKQPEKTRGTQNHASSRKEKKPQPRYQSRKPQKTSWGSVFAAVAALLVLVVACGLFLRQMKAYSHDVPSYAAPTQTEATVPVETKPIPSISELPMAYQEQIRKYVTAIEEGWNPEQCSNADISIVTPNVPNTDELGYTLIDLDGDGSEELLITDGNVIYSMYSLSPESEAVSWITGWERSSYYLSVDHMIVNIGSGGAAVTYYEFYKFTGIGLSKINSVTFNADVDPENPWFLGDLEEPITEEEANARIEAYPHRYISHRPLSGREVEPEGKVPEKTVLNLYAQKLPDLLAGYTKSAIPTFCFYDYDGDGDSDLLIGAEQAVYGILWENTQADGTTGVMLSPYNFSEYAYLCENGVMEYVGYGQGYTHSEYCDVRDDGKLDYIFTDGEKWFTRNGDGENISISDSEANAILGKYKRVNLPWKDISEFPVPIRASGERTPQELLEGVFLPIATSGKRVTREELKLIMEENGFPPSAMGEDVIECMVSDTCHITLFGYLTEGEEQVVTELQYHVPDEINRAAAVRWEGEQAQYFTYVDWIGNGVRADSIEALKDFLNADAETLLPRKAAEGFADAYFRRDKNGMLENMVSSQTGISPGNMFSGNEDIQIEKITGWEDAEARYAQAGSVTVSAAAYIDSPDSYTYLTMEMVKENEKWKVRSYSLEK